jgi:hypothetical protein
VGAVLQLTPDLLVIYAGNNWPMRLPVHPGAGLDDSQSAAAAVREGGIRGLLYELHERTREFSDKVLATIAHLTEVRGIPVVLVLPEVNLADWNRNRPVAWLPGESSQQWHELHAEALSCSRSGKLETAASIAERMIELDARTCPTSLELLARIRSQQGQTVAALDLYREAVDARCWDNYPSTPSTNSVIRDAMRSSAQKYGFDLVDLPEIFQQYLDSEIPGRRLFLDYCHLTLEGMKVAMAATAVKILKLSDASYQEDLDWRYLVEQLPDPKIPPATDALTKFMTALYNAHYGVIGDEVLSDAERNRSVPTRYWLESAVRSWPGIEAPMRAYVATRSVPRDSLRFSIELQKFYDSISLLERQSAHQQSLDPELIESICCSTDYCNSPVLKQL